jgi:hypothetical protein
MKMVSRGLAIRRNTERAGAQIRTIVFSLLTFATSQPAEPMVPAPDF